eukprot:scaffold256_cov261-Pinguiococcus_pyrenoidosus.AAC.10
MLIDCRMRSWSRRNEGKNPKTLFARKLPRDMAPRRRAFGNMARRCSQVGKHFRLGAGACRSKPTSRQEGKAI